MTDRSPEFLEAQRKLRENAAKMAKEPKALEKLGKILAKWREEEGRA